MKQGKERTSPCLACVFIAYPSLISEYVVIFLIGLQSNVPMIIFTAVRITAMISSTATDISKLFFSAPITENITRNIVGK